MAETNDGLITIVGLGPAGAGYVTREAWDALQQAESLYLRTAHHPAVADFPPHIQYQSFDHVYDTAAAFPDVYDAITRSVIAHARERGPITYAVPGDPHVAEATVSAIAAAAATAGIAVRVVPGLSFIEPTLRALEVDAMSSGLQLYDALAIASYQHPPINPDTPLLLAQVYDRRVASELKLALMAIYPDEHPVSLVHAAATGHEQVETIALYAIDRSDHIDHLTSLYVPALPAPATLAALAEATAVLRGPDGCPWDREQTPRSLRAGFLEEVGEALQALDEDDAAALQEELGDVLWHIVMQVQLAREEDLFTWSDVIASIYQKIRRRHPHVWPPAEDPDQWEADDSDAVVANWELLKQQEKNGAESESLLDNIPPVLPALAKAQKIQGRVRKVGFDWPDESGVVAKVREEIAELERAAGPAGQKDELGDLLFAVVNWSRWLGIDAESALREANARFSRRFRLLESLAAAQSLDLDAAGLDTLEALWQEAKRLSTEEQI